MFESRISVVENQLQLERAKGLRLPPRWGHKSDAGRVYERDDGQWNRACGHFVAADTPREFDRHHQEVLVGDQLAVSGRLGSLDHEHVLGRDILDFALLLLCRVAIILNLVQFQLQCLLTFLTRLDGATLLFNQGVGGGEVMMVCF